jgi:PAS domain S-box-containing protein
MEFTLFSFIYLFTAVAAFLVALLAIQRKVVLGALELFWLALAVTESTYFCFVEASVVTQEWKVFWASVSYIGASVIPVFYLLFVLRFTKLIRYREIRFGCFLWVIPIITIVFAFTNECHHFLWKDFSGISPETNIMTYGHGFWFWTGYTLYSYFLLTIATYYLFEFILHNRKKKAYKRQGYLVAIAGIIPWIVSICYILDLNPVKGLDIAPISTLISAILFTDAILRSTFLHLVPVARETLVETLPLGIVSLDEQNRIQDINERAKFYLGVRKDDVLGMTLFQAVSEHGTLLNAVLSKKNPEEVELSAGSVFQSFQIVKQPLRSLTGSRLITIQDTTEQVMREKELLEAKSKAEESDKLKTAFLANMSHEIRTPMNGILGFISLLQREDLTEVERKGYLSIIRANYDRLLGTLNDIIDLSKVEAGQMQLSTTEFDVNEVLINLYDLFRQEAETRGLLFQRCVLVPEGISIIHSDKAKIYSITTNIVKNALKYTKNGFVRYECERTPTDLIFQVIDSGIGIPEDKLHSIFERFVQVDSSYQRAYEGSGLGLSISKAYTEMLGGVISVESVVDKGSTFTVKIPIRSVAL